MKLMSNGDDDNNDDKYEVHVFLKDDVICRSNEENYFLNTPKFL